jgi:hypothetical protein
LGARESFPRIDVVRSERHDAAAQFDDSCLVLRFVGGRELGAQLREVTRRGPRSGNREREKNRYDQTRSDTANDDAFRARFSINFSRRGCDSTRCFTCCSI